MTKPDVDALIKELGAQERPLLSSLASGTDWKRAGVTLKTVARLMMNFLVGGACRTPRLTGAGRARGNRKKSRRSR
jgi:hypothetical protein